MKMIYNNFDTLEISFKCKIPDKILNLLDDARNEAEITKSKKIIEIGNNKLQAFVSERGMRGYRYQFSTGADKHIWWIRNSKEYDWNVRVKIRSLCLAINGYKKAKEQIIKILREDLRAKGLEEDNFMPFERVSRVDYCMDFLIEGDFEPEIKDFICHGRTKKSKHGNFYFNEISTGQLVETITLGKMPNRQICFYNKIKEIEATSKLYWYKIWNLEKEKIEGQIWRIEIRAGKDELNNWDLDTFDDLEDKIGNVVLDILGSYKYKEPNKNDTNLTRWPMNKLWNKAIYTAQSNLFEYTSKITSKIALEDIRKATIKRYNKLILAISIGLTAASGKDISEIPEVLDHVCSHILDEIELNPQKLIQKYKKKLNDFAELNNNS